MTMHARLASIFLNRQFARFAAVGVLNSAFSYAVFAILIWCGAHYTLATLVSLVLGILFNFRTTGVLVFNSRDHRRLWRFAATHLLGYLINIGCQRLLHAAGVDPYSSGLIAVFPAMLTVFTLCRYVVFPTELPARSLTNTMDPQQRPVP